MVEENHLVLNTQSIQDIIQCINSDQMESRSQAVLHIASLSTSNIEELGNLMGPHSLFERLLSFLDPNVSTTNLQHNTIHAMWILARDLTALGKEFSGTSFYEVVRKYLRDSNPQIVIDCVNITMVLFLEGNAEVDLPHVAFDLNSLLNPLGEVIILNAAASALIRLLEKNENAREMLVGDEVIPKLGLLLHISDTQLIQNVIVLLIELIEGVYEYQEILMQSNIVPRITELLGCPNPEVRVECLRLINMLASSANHRKDVIVKTRIVPKLVKMFSSKTPKIADLAMLSVSAIASGDNNHIEAVVSANAIPKLVHALSSTNTTTVHTSVQALEHVTRGTRRQQDVLVRNHAIRYLIQLVGVEDENISRIAATTLDHLVTGCELGKNTFIRKNTISAFDKLLGSPCVHVKRHVVDILASIVCDNVIHKATIFESELAPKIVALLSSEDTRTTISALLVLSRIFNPGTIEQIDLLVGYDAVPTLIRLLDLEDYRIVENAAGVLSKIANGTTGHRDVLLRRRAVVRFVQLLSRNNTEIVQKASEALRNFSRGTREHIDAIAGIEGSVSKLVTLLASNRPSITQNCADILGAIACQEHRSVMTETLAIPKLIELLCSCNLHIVETTSKVLSDLSNCTTGYHESLIEETVIERLAILLTWSSTSVVLHVAGILANIASGANHQTKEKIIKYGCVCKLRMILGAYSSNSVVIQKAVEALANISTECVNIDDAFIHLVPNMIELSSSRNLNVVQNATRVLVNLSQGNSNYKNAIMDHGAIPKLVHQLNPRCLLIATQVAEIFVGVMHTMPGLQATIARSRVVPKVIALLTVHDNPTIVAMLQVLIGISAISNENHQYIVRHNAVPEIIALLRVRESDVVSMALIVLSNLASGLDENKELLLAHGVVEHSVPLLVHNDSAVRTDAASLLRILSGGKSHHLQAMIRKNVVPKLIRILEAASDRDVYLLLHISIIFVNISSSSREHRELIIKNRGMEALVSLLRVNDESIKCNVIEALGCLATDLPENATPMEPTVVDSVVGLLGSEDVKSVERASKAVIRMLLAPGNQIDAFVKSGAMTRVVMLLESDDAVVARNVAAIISIICNTDNQYRQTLMETEVLSKLFPCLHSADLLLVIASAQTLAVLCSDSESNGAIETRRCAIEKLNMLQKSEDPALVQYVTVALKMIMGECGRPVEDHSQALEIIREITHSPGTPSTNASGANATVKKVVPVSKLFKLLNSRDTAVVRQTVETLGKVYGAKDGCRQPEWKSKIIQKLIALFENGTEEVQVSVGITLCKIGKNTDDTRVDHAVVSKLVRLLSSRSKTVKLQAVEALNTIVSFSQEHQRALERSGAVMKLVKLLCIQDKALSQSSIKLLKILSLSCTKRMKDAMIEKWYSIETLIEMLQPPITNTLRESLDILLVACTDSDLLRSAVIQRGGVTKLMSLIQCSDSHVVLTATRILKTLTNGTHEHRDAIIQGDVILKLSYLLEMSNEQVQIEAIEIVHCLMTKGTLLHRAPVLRNKIIPKMVHLLGLQKDTITKSILKTFTVIFQARNGEINDETKMEVVKNVSGLLDISTVSLEKEVSIVLRTLASGSIENTKILLKNGAIHSLAVLLRSRDMDVVEQSTCTLAAICRSGPEFKHAICDNVIAVRNLLSLLDTCGVHIIKLVVEILKSLVEGLPASRTVLIQYGATNKLVSFFGVAEVAVDCALVVLSLMEQCDEKTVRTVMQAFGNALCGAAAQESTNHIRSLLSSVDNQSLEILRHVALILGSLFCGTHDASCFQLRNNAVKGMMSILKSKNPCITPLVLAVMPRLAFDSGSVTNFLVRNDAIVSLLELMSDANHTILKLAMWGLKTVTVAQRYYANHVPDLLRSMAIPNLVELLAISDSMIASNALHVLRDILRDTVQQTHIEIPDQAILRLAKCLNSYDNSTVKTAIETLRYIALRQESYVTILLSTNAIRLVQVSLLSNNPAICHEALLLLSIVASGPRQHLNIIVNNNAVAKYVELIDSSNIDCKYAVTTLLLHITAGDIEHKDHLLRHGAIPKLIPLLASNDPSLLNPAVGIFRNLSDGSMTQKNWLVQQGALVKLVPLLDSPEKAIVTCVTETLWHLSNGSDAHREALVQNDAIPKLVGLLRLPNVDVLTPIETLRRLASSSERYCQLVKCSHAIPPLASILDTHAHHVEITRCARNLFQLLGQPTCSTLSTGRLVTEEDVTCCAICMENLTQGERMLELACHHCYHEECLKQWILRRRTCPLCRAVIERGFC